MNSVTLIGTVQEPVDGAAFMLAVDRALVPVLLGHSHPSPTSGACGSSKARFAQGQPI